MIAKERLEKEALGNNVKDYAINDEIKFDFDLSTKENLKDIFEKTK